MPFHSEDPIDTESVSTAMIVSDTICVILASLVLVLFLAFLLLWMRQRRIVRDLERARSDTSFRKDDAAWLLEEARQLAESIPRLTEK